MGEIKSTLDLVMERTRHLSLSDEERSRQQEEAYDKRLKGLLQQVADGTLTVDGFRDRSAALQAELKVSGRQALAAGIAGRLDPDQDNRVWMELFGAIAPAACAPVEQVADAYRKRRRALCQAGEKRLQACLARDHGISGSAVIPNPLKEPACRKDLADLKKQALADMRSRVRKAFSSDHT